jgi:hypothetical protein
VKGLTGVEPTVSLAACAGVINAIQSVERGTRFPSLIHTKCKLLKRIRSLMAKANAIRPIAALFRAKMRPEIINMNEEEIGALFYARRNADRIC